MRVLIDGDGCPVVGIAAELCAGRGIPCLLLCDTAHDMRRGDVQVLTFDKGADSVDYALANRVQPGDVVITQDYGVASMCLARGARVLHQDGWEYTPRNIDALLLQRYQAWKFRRGGGRIKGKGRGRRAQDECFRAALSGILEQIPGEA